MMNAPMMMDPATGGPGGPGTGPGGGADPEELAAEKARADRAEAAARAAMQEAAKQEARADAAEQPRRYTIEAGDTLRLGMNDYTCEGDAACVLTINSQGELSITGNLRSVMRRQAEVPLGVTLPTPTSPDGNVFTIPAGTTAMRGPVDIACVAGGPDCQVRIEGNSVFSGGGTVMVTMPRTSLSFQGAVPAGFTPLAYSMTVPAGTTAYHGRVDFACAAGGDDCVVVVDANGLMSSSGGMVTARVSRTVINVEGLPDDFMPAAYSIVVAEGDTASNGPMDFECETGAPDCLVVVTATGEVSASGTVAVTVPRMVVENPLASRVTALTIDNDFEIAEGSTTIRNTYLEFSCPADADTNNNACRVLVDTDGTIYGTSDTRVKSLATAFYASRPTPALAFVTVPAVTAPGGTAMTVAPVARSAPRLVTVRNESPNTTTKLINLAGEFPMRTVIVRGGETTSTGTRMVGAVHDEHPRATLTTDWPSAPSGGAQSQDTSQARANPRTAGTVGMIYDNQLTYEQYTPYGWVESDATAAGTITLDADNGVTVKLASRPGFPGTGSGVTTMGQGLAFNDMKRSSTSPRPADTSGNALLTWAQSHGDVEITFTKDHKGDDPQGDGAHYWARDVEFATGGTTGPDGRYEFWLSSRVGSGSSDDQFLSYAAYGLFNFIDNTLMAGNVHRAADAAARTYPLATARLQGLHFGIDTPDAQMHALGTLTTNIEAVYTGRTTAFMMLSSGAVADIQNCARAPDTACAGAGVDAVHMNPAEELLRLRGDVQLTAQFGSAVNGNRIRGEINNFEAFVENAQGGGRWMGQWLDRANVGQ